MTPVILLSDGYIANGSEPWRIPDAKSLQPIEVTHPRPPQSTAMCFMPYARDERLARPWAIPGTPGLMHRIGGLEKQDITGNVSYDPDNHQHMVRLRAAQGGGHRPANCRRKTVEGPASGQAAGAELGRHLRRLRHGGPRSAATQAARWPMPTCAISIRCRANLGEILAAVRKSADSGIEPAGNCGC